MAALFPKIYDIIDKNPNKHEILRWREPTSTEVLQPEVWEGFALRPLDPPGALSLLLLHTEPLYELSSSSLRKQILTEKLMELHTRVDKELIGRRYPRKKIQDLLAGEISATKPSGSFLLEEALCELFQIQKVILNRRTKSLSFAPSDLRLWSTEKPIVFAEEDNVWSFQPVFQRSFGDWLVAKEDEGWKLSWPTAEGKYEELKAALVTRNIVLEGKQKKDELASILGRAQALQILRSLRIESPS
jgi:hypothetical protein